MNPMNMLFTVMKARGINLPTDINTNDPNAILQYLMQNGKITQEQYNRAYQQYRLMYGNNSQQQNQNKY